MIGGVTVREAPDSDFIISANASNTSEVIDAASRDEKRIQVAVMVTTLVGIIQVSLKTVTTPTEQLWLTGQRKVTQSTQKSLFSEAATCLNHC